MGKIYTFGSNAKGQLGTGDCEDHCEPVLAKLDADETQGIVFPVRDINGGANHTILVDSTGRVWACGDNKLGQCGLIDEENVFLLRRSSIIDEAMTKEGIDFIKCYCSWDTVFLVDNRGNLWCFGENIYGQCGVDSTDEKKLFVKNSSIISFKQRSGVSFVSCSTRHVVVVTEDGHAYGWGGHNKNNELPIFKGPDASVDIVRRRYGGCESGVRATSSSGKSTSAGLNVQPTRLNVPPIRAAACGLNCTSFITESGNIIVYGKCREISIPYLQQQTSLIEVHMLWNTLIAINEDGLLLGTGRNDYGQLSFIDRSIEHACDHQPDSPNKIPISSRRKILCLANGSEHCLALLSCNCIFSWGWNEHGNCGTHACDTVDYMHRIPLSLKSRLLLACGAGHSIIVDNAP